VEGQGRLRGQRAGRRRHAQALKDHRAMNAPLAGGRRG
jgi:hypothetical protein